MIAQKDKDRFWAKVEKKGKDECWEWTACKDYQEYGVFWLAPKNKRAHRFSWTLHCGKIPDGLCVCHHCDNPSCVNPAHLFVGTTVDNTQDSVQKGRRQQGEAHANSKLTEEMVLQIRCDYENMIKKSVYKLTGKYGVSHVTIHRIVTRKTWRHI